MLADFGDLGNACQSGEDQGKNQRSQCFVR